MVSSRFQSDFDQFGISGETFRISTRPFRRFPYRVSELVGDRLFYGIGQIDPYLEFVFLPVLLDPLGRPRSISLLAHLVEIGQIDPEDELPTVVQHV